MNSPRKTANARAIAMLVVFVILIPFLPLLISRRWDWWEAWAFAGIMIVGFVTSRTLAVRRHPDLIQERAQLMRHDNVESWDKVLAPLTVLTGGFVPLVAGLDALFSWSPRFSWPLKAIALVTILAGYALGSYALVENRFFSATVRIQADRGHTVVSTGPYGWIRHPGYAGVLLTYLATPIFLDALSAFVPVLLLAVVLAIRTRLEDQTLQNRLEGYRQYASCVRYRLLPGIW